MIEESATLSDTIIEKLKKQHLFENLASDDIKSAITRFGEIHILTGELAFRKGERYHKGIYFLLSGEITLSNPSSSISVSCHNCPVGLSTFLGKTMYTMNAVAQSDCDLLFVHELCIYRLMELSDDFRTKLIKDIQVRLTHLENSSNTFLMQSVYQTVSGVMSSPVITIQTGKSVVVAANLMKEHKISSLLVVNRKQIVKGLVTSTDLTRKFLVDLENNINNQDIENYMDLEPVTFPPEFPIVEALNELQIAGKTHGVVMQNSKPAGIVSIHNISTMLFENSHLYCAHIDNMTNFEELKIVFTQIYRAAKTLATSSRVSREELTALSSIHRAIHKKAFQLTSDAFKAEKNFKLTDYSYCYLLLGAGARREMDLRPQINNAFILADDVPDWAEKMFMEFAAKYHENLVNIGYYPHNSNDDVMTINIVHKYSKWIEEIDGWSSKGNKSDKKYAFAMLIDIAALEGDIKLAWSIRNYVLKKAADRPAILSALVKQYPAIKIPVSQFGSFIVEKDGEYEGMFNLKTQALSYIVNITRLLAIYAGITDMGTIERIEHLERKKIISEELATQAIIAFDTITETLINEQVNQSVNNQKVTSYISPASLSLFYQEKLKRALQFATIYTSYGVKILNEI